MPLNDRQARFVEEYLVDLNGKQAALRAGYSEKGAEVHASKLLSQAKVREAVEAGKAKLAQSTKVTKEWVVAEAQKLYAQASKLNDHGPAKSTLELIARLHGHIIDRKDVRLVKTLDDLNDEELAQLAAHAAAETHASPEPRRKETKH